ncbi:polymorphic toxin-type HINT domain-containing protein [Singulisphaera sp. Ch08]|uniref:Polymorphic toxin-type HINT domain-containing protein n=1 Tax=Singulisphaera sp. Ch08 TaxID=3120278 RepID=A0AAU7CMB4_9BACT
MIEEVPLAYQAQPVSIDTITGPVGYRRMSCFGAGTPVHTLAGVQPIESLKEGDRVLTQDTQTGALGYQPILVVHRNPPSPTYRITLGDETVISSHFHRFWKAGQGWVMARDLAPGDTIRTLGGLVRVGSIDAADVQPVFNLDVAGNADFFVGRQGALVHDNTLPDLRQTPFDAPPRLATASSVSQ